MQIYVVDSDVAEMIKEQGYDLSSFEDVNGSPIWEFSYDGGNLDIGELVVNNKIIVVDGPKTVYL